VSSAHASVALSAACRRPREPTIRDVTGPSVAPGQTGRETGAWPWAQDDDGCGPAAPAAMSRVDRLSPLTIPTRLFRAVLMPLLEP
jgi:hypothetical protein